ncbi:uncharacterized protein EV420DRAFT_124537 [Desarmillaria tabescens]|uniref:DUF962-domain-containing protein n=1 Tax=Armillaria tabescens TaxID=1929756 RepID=A0AA39N9W4_ARMTA|nr:uncharacterized protein EV420DRAFT_124537 [Desarmillaria tabescens]KAK0461709.1 hypothetical protein EV420DRAFT_124537 [Desarmillaria tabescens]
MVSELFDIRKQFTFYGSYHTNPINVTIHIICVPMILWTGLVMGTHVLPTWLPDIHFAINNYLAFDLNFSTVWAVTNLLYYYILEPTAAFIYTPQMTLCFLSAMKFSERSDHMAIALTVHVLCWIAQFLGHGIAEKRAPALLDNILGAAVLAPFFVHLEILYKLGYNPKLHKIIINDIGKEVTKLRKAEGVKKRAASQTVADEPLARKN